MKIMLLISHKSNEAISKVIEPSIFCKNTFIHMSSRRVVILMSSKYDHVIIWWIYSLKHYQLQHLKSWYTVLESVNSRILHCKLLNLYILLRGENDHTNCTIFPSLRFFSHQVFPWQGFNEAYSLYMVIQWGVL